MKRLVAEVVKHIMILLKVVADNALITQDQEVVVVMMNTTPIVQLIHVQLIRFKQKLEGAPIVQNTK